MNADLKKLYNAKAVILKESSLSQYNDHLRAAATDKCRPVQQESAKRVRSREKRCKRIERAHLFFTRWLPTFALMLLVLFAVVFLLQNVLSVTFDDFVERSREFALERDEKFPKLLITANLKRADADERISVFNDPRFEVDCLAFLIGGLLWATVALAFGHAMLDSKKREISGAVFLFDLLLIVALLVVLMVKSLSVIGAVIGVLWMAFSGIRLMWVCGWPLLLSYVLLNVIVMVGTTKYESLAKTHRTKVAPALPSIKGLKAEIAAEKVDCERKCAAIRKPFEAQEKYDSQNLSAWKALPAYLRDYGTVNQLIWVIENGYARDIVGARNYLDRKAYEAGVKRQLAQVQSTSEAALRAARDAEAAARAAEAAANAPIDVSVTVHYN